MYMYTGSQTHSNLSLNIFHTKAIKLNLLWNTRERSGGVKECVYEVDGYTSR